MSDAEIAIAVDFLKGCYRLLHEIRDLLRDWKPSLAPTQAALPLGEDDGLPEPGGIASAIAAAPRKWGNAVKVYEYLWSSLERTQFTIEDLFDDWKEITNATGGKVRPSSFPKVLSAIVAAGAATRGGFDNRRYVLHEPTDELRAAVEEARKGRRTT